MYIAVSDEEIQSKVSDLMNQILHQIEAKDQERRKVLEQAAMATHKNNVARMEKEGFIPLKGGEGVLYKELKTGDGVLPSNTSIVKVHYEGRLLDGTKFDSSYDRDSPFTVYMSNPGLIQGFLIALKQMSKGAKWKVFIPYSMAYNDQEQGPIKPYSDLLFTLEITNIEN